MNQEENTPIKRVAIYARKSSDDSKRDKVYNSIDAQFDICRGYVKLHESEGWAVAAEYSDLGISGKTMDRPGMQQLLAAVRNHEIDIIVAYRLDRISRSVVNYLNFQEEMKNLKVPIFLSSEPIDSTTADGRFNVNIRMSFAEYEREMDSLRIREKFAATAERGIFVGGVAPYGYERRGHEGIFVNEATAPVVREIFERYSAGEMRSAIAADLNRRSVPLPCKSPNKEQASDRQWDSGRLSRLLERPVYKGNIVFNGQILPGRHEALVTEEMWNQAQERMKEEKKERDENKVQRRLSYPLKGVLHCPDCGSRLVGVYTTKGAGRAIRYYACPKHRTSRLKTKCGYQGIAALTIEEAMLSKLSALANEGQVVNAICESVPGLKRRDVTKALSHIETLGQFITPDQLSALYGLVFKDVHYNRETSRLVTERYVL